MASQSRRSWFSFRQGSPPLSDSQWTFWSLPGLSQLHSYLSGRNTVAPTKVIISVASTSDPSSLVEPPLKHKSDGADSVSDNEDNVSTRRRSPRLARRSSSTQPIVAPPDIAEQALSPTTTLATSVSSQQQASLFHTEGELQPLSSIRPVASTEEAQSSLRAMTQAAYIAAATCPYAVSSLANRSLKSFDSIPESLLPRRRLLLPRKRKTLVLDLDETLVHATSRAGRRAHYDLVLEVMVDRFACLYYISKRPHVDFFLQKVSEWYQVVIFTASMAEYADPVIDWLDAGRNIISRRYFRPSCSLVNGNYVKDLSAVESDLKRVCLVDNAAQSYLHHPDNGIPIQPWVNDMDDEALLDLLPFLDALRFCEDVRSVLSLRRLL